MSTFSNQNKSSNPSWDFPYISGTGRTWNEMTDIWDETFETWDELGLLTWTYLNKHSNPSYSNFNRSSNPSYSNSSISGTPTWTNQNKTS